MPSPTSSIPPSPTWGLMCACYTQIYTVVPLRLVSSLRDQGLRSSLCSWFQRFLTDRPQVWSLETLNTGTLSRLHPESSALPPMATAMPGPECLQDQGDSVRHQEGEQQIHYIPLSIYGTLVKKWAATGTLEFTSLWTWDGLYTSPLWWR